MGAQETKGKPTPKRSEREAARRKQREAMRTGDERNYPTVAAGPERAVVRDAIDARRPYWQLALPLWLGGLVLSLMPSLAARQAGGLTFPLVIGLLLADMVVARRTVRRAVAAAFPDGTREPQKTLVWYGTARNMQFRRSRLPRPRVEPGRRGS